MLRDNGDGTMTYLGLPPKALRNLEAMSTEPMVYPHGHFFRNGACIKCHASERERTIETQIEVTVRMFSTSAGEPLALLSIASDGTIGFLRGWGADRHPIAFARLTKRLRAEQGGRVVIPHELDSKTKRWMHWLGLPVPERIPAEVEL